MSETLRTSHIESDDMVAHINGNEIFGGNYMIGSELMKTGMNPIDPDFFLKQFGGNGVTFDTLGIPGIYLSQRDLNLNTKALPLNHNGNKHNTLTDDIHDKLLELVSSKKHNNNKSKSKKNKHSNRLSKTKKQKK